MPLVPTPPNGSSGIPACRTTSLKQIPPEEVIESTFSCSFSSPPKRYSASGLGNDFKSLPKPLALYLFGGNEKEQEKILSLTSSGGVCFNDVVLQAGIPELPFGGVGSSGMGKYHGKAGFDNFTHYKSVLKRPFWLDLNFRYPPYKLNLSLLKKILS